MMMNGFSRWMLVAVFSSFAGNSVWAAGKNVLRVCADPNNPPYSDKSGKGFENKIAGILAKEMGAAVEYTWFPQRLGFVRNTLKAKLPDMEDYKCDVIIGVPTGSELTANTKPYYRSTYALVFAKGRGWDDLKSADDLERLPPARKDKLRIAMFDGSPATTWLLNHHLIDQAIPYQTMTGDAAINTAQILEKDLLAKKIDMAIVWGPIAGYVLYHNKANAFGLIPMRSEGSIRFDFPISMGVRFGDKARKEQLEALIDKKAEEIQALLRQYHVPTVDQDGQRISAQSP